jgi:hypothetical protein
MPEHYTDKNKFDALIASGAAVLVDFTATWYRHFYFY